MTFDYEIKKTAKGLFYPVKNGKRFTKTNFARKYDARNVVREAVNKYGVEKLEEIFA